MVRGCRIVVGQDKGLDVYDREVGEGSDLPDRGRNRHDDPARDKLQRKLQLRPACCIADVEATASQDLASEI
ncbi:hypothetical protein GCM10010520_29650 [Rhizobium viscosum]